MSDITQINERIVRFTGGASVSKEYTLGEEIQFSSIKAEVVEVKEKNNHDGTKDRTFVFKLLTIDEE